MALDDARRRNILLGLIAAKANNELDSEDSKIYDSLLESGEIERLVPQFEQILDEARQTKSEFDNPNPSPFLTSARQVGSAFAGGLVGRSDETGMTMANIAEEAGKMAPTAIGAALGSPAGPAGMAVGAAAGKSLQNVGQQLAAQAGEAEDVNPVEAVVEPVAAAALQLVAGKATEKASQLIKKTGPTIRKGLEKLIRGFTGIKERESTRVLRDPTLFQSAIPSKQAGEEMAEALSGQGLKSGTGALKEVTGSRFPSQESAISFVSGALDDLEAGSLTTQKAIVARQMATREVGRPKFQNPLQAAEKREIARGIEALDDLIEESVPGWRGFVKKFADAKTVETFSNLLPLNQNMTPNQLRIMLNLINIGGGAGTSFQTGNPLFAAAALAITSLQSPFMASIPIRVAGRAITAAGAIPAGAGAAISGAAASAGAEAISDAANAGQLQ